MKRFMSIDVLAGAFFCLFGAATVWFAHALNFGSAGRLGPGAFPSLLGCALVLVGTVVAARSILGDGVILHGIAWRPLAAVLGGLLAFGILVPRLGLVIATIVAVVIARLGQRPIKPVETAILSLFLAAFVTIVFVWALAVSMPVWPVG
ncbi:MAG: tripartite tricarboxylate transporter TctB family protein [Hyphomicrobiaceae bacterium]|nr:MAG: tripartite tricarboxylate transporter TctB family protein [Hyphomicrobiaceae bacterium]